MQNVETCACQKLVRFPVRNSAIVSAQEWKQPLKRRQQILNAGSDFLDKIAFFQKSLLSCDSQHFLLFCCETVLRFSPSPPPALFSVPSKPLFAYLGNKKICAIPRSALLLKFSSQRAIPNYLPQNEEVPADHQLTSPSSVAFTPAQFVPHIMTHY